MARQAIHDVAVERMTSLAAYWTSGVTVVAGWTAQEWFGFIGLLLAVGTFGLNWFYRHKQYQHSLIMIEKAKREEFEEDGHRPG